MKFFKNDDTADSNLLATLVIVISIFLLIGLVGSTQVEAKQVIKESPAEPVQERVYDEPAEEYPDHVYQFIKRWRKVAQQEYRVHGILPSIKLAQGMLESGFGLSFAVSKHNAFFCIKAHEWDGPDFELRGSKYREYETPWLSWRDHSLFLKRDRYEGLLELETPAEWADFLQEKGYAEDPKYAKKLKRLIKIYHLWQYDHK